MEAADLHYEVLHVRLRKNLRGLGLSITGGSIGSSAAWSPLTAAHPLFAGVDDAMTTTSPLPDQGSAGGDGRKTSLSCGLSQHLLHHLIRVRTVYPSEPAADAGLKPGDFLLQANDRNMVAMTSVVSDRCSACLHISADAEIASLSRHQRLSSTAVVSRVAAAAASLARDIIRHKKGETGGSRKREIACACAVVVFVGKHIA